MLNSLLSPELTKVLVGDMFAGAGGTGTGCELAMLELGLSPELLAINHWDLALQVHRKNHPNARHFPSNVFRFDPKAAVPSGKLDFLMASPTCSTFSRAKGGRPISWDQRYGRMTPRQVERWCRELKPEVLLVENVPEFVQWGPLMRALDKKGEQLRDEEGRPLWKPNPKHKAKLFRAWIKRLERMGYRCEWRILNCANYGDATTRKRFFLIGRKDKQPIVWPEETHAPADEIDTRYLFGRVKLPHRAAREVILWEIKGRSIFDRKNPLAAKTLIRIYRGICKFEWPPVFIVKLRLYMESLGIEVPDVLVRLGDSARPLLVRSGMHKSNALCVRDAATDPLATVTTDGGIGVLEAGLVVLRNHADMRSISEPLPATCAGGSHLGLAEGAFLLPQHFGAAARSTGKPLPPLVTVNRTAVVEPFTMANRTGNAPKPIDMPIPPVVTSGGVGLVEPFTFPTNQGKKRARGLDPVKKPLGTIVTKDMRALVAPFVLSQGAGGAPREVSEPIPAAPTRGAHSLIAPYYGTGEPKSVEEPLSTATTKARFGLVVPVTHHDDSSRSRSTDQPLPTVTAAPRGELSFISPAWGERQGQDVRVHSITDPLPTLCAKGRMPLVHGIVQGDLDEVDILFRMLEPVELASAHSFPQGYFDDQELTKTDVIRMVGNSVPVRTARALVYSIFKNWRRSA